MKVRYSPVTQVTAGSTFRTVPIHPTATVKVRYNAVTQITSKSMQ